MKKRLLVMTVLLLTALPICFASACVGTGATSYELAGYDFSYDNILEIGYIASISDDGGTPYGNTVYRLQKGKSQDGDEIIKSVAEAWQNMQSNVTFKRQKKFNVLMAAGGAGEVVCVFNDGSRVSMYKDEVENLKINNGKSCRLSEDDMKYYSNLRDAYAYIIRRENKVLSLSPASLNNAKLKSYDFSASNIIQVELEIQECTHGSTYTIKRGESAEKDQAVLQVSDLWTVFQNKAKFNDNVNGRDKAIVGGSVWKFKCVFTDGSSVEIYEDNFQNYVFNNSEACQLDDEEVYKILYGVKDIMAKEEYMIYHYEH